MLIEGDSRKRTREDVAALVREGAGELTSLYEARAYLIYNLALRITCDVGKAKASAQRAFLGQAEAGATPGALIPAVVKTALGDAKARPKLSGLGVPEEGHVYVWKANAALAPPERAALALQALAEADARETAAALSLSEDRAAALLERALATFATAVQVAPDAAADAYAELSWAEPPVELWESLYPSFYKALDRRMRAEAEQGDAAETVVLAPLELSRRERRRARKGRRRLPRPRLGALVGIALPALLVAGAIAFIQRPADHKKPAAQTTSTTPDQFSSFDGQPSATTTTPDTSTPSTDDSAAAPQPLLAKKRKPLTPQELDHLRMQELQALQKYEKQQTDKRLSQAQRDYAGQRAAALRDLARRRAAADRRDRELARRERAQARRERQFKRQKQSGGGGGSPNVTIIDGGNSTGGSGGSGGGGTGTGGGGGSTSPQDPSQQCIQDQDTGQYICQTP